MLQAIQEKIRMKFVSQNSVAMDEGSTGQVYASCRGTKAGLAHQLDKSELQLGSGICCTISLSCHQDNVKLDSPNCILCCFEPGDRTGKRVSLLAQTASLQCHRETAHAETFAFLSQPRN